MISQLLWSRRTRLCLPVVCLGLLTLFAGCGGTEEADGTSGANGSPGTNGTVGTNDEPESNGDVGSNGDVTDNGAPSTNDPSMPESTTDDNPPMVEPAAVADDADAIAAVEALGVVLSLNADGQVVKADCKAAALNDEQALLLVPFTHLADLSLENSSITDAGLEALLSQMPQIKILGLRRCSLLTDAGFAALSHLIGLERALFLYTNISNEGLAAHSPLTTLRVLDLRGCVRIGNAGMVHLAGLVNFVDLKMRSPSIYDTGLAHLAGMTKMRYLTLEDAAVTTGGMVHLSGMHDLRQLNLNRSYVDDTALTHFTEATQLQDLRLRQTSFTGPGLDHLPDAVVETLTFLDLSEIRISDEGLSHAARFINLKTLDLWNGTVTDEGLVHLAGMHQIEDLNLDSNPVTSAGMSHLTELTTLTILNLSRTQIDDAALDQLTALTNLRQLSIENVTNITPEAVARFQEALPNCTMKR